MDNDGQFFCYLGWVNTFQTAAQLEQHHYLFHTAEQLKVWGINHSQLDRIKVALLEDSGSDQETASGVAISEQQQIRAALRESVRGKTISEAMSMSETPSKPEVSRL
jgi:hypothetical protein